MTQIENAPSGRMTTVRVAAPIPVDKLSYLISEYVYRLEDSVSKYRTGTDRAGRSRLDNPEVIGRDVAYLYDQVRTLMDKASAVREHGDITEAERFELDLRLYDAETALRRAKDTAEQFPRAR